MIGETATRLKLVIGLALAIALDTAVQLCWKRLAAAIPIEMSPWALLDAMLHQPLFAAVVVLLVAQLVNWLKVLETADLSFAKPITSLSKISVLVLSVVYLGESINLEKIAGIAIVIAGVWCVCQTKRETRGAASP